MHLELERQHVNTREQKLHAGNAGKEVAMQGPYGQVVTEKEGRHLGSKKKGEEKGERPKGNMQKGAKKVEPTKCKLHLWRPLKQWYVLKYLKGNI